MAVDSDHSVSLPSPPPPRPAARQAAIEAALRRFDGVEEAPADPSSAKARPQKWWASMHRRPAGALVTAALIAVISVPVALITLREQESNVAPPVRQSTTAEPGRDATANARFTEEALNSSVDESAPAEQPLPPERSTTPAAPAAPVTKTVATSDQQKSAQEAQPSVIAPAAPAPPPPPPPASPAARTTANQSAEGLAEDSVVVSGSRIPRANLEKQRSAESASPLGVMDEEGEFLSRLQAAFRANDHRAVAALVALPLRVNFDDGTVTYRSMSDIDRDFDRIFTPEVRRSVLGQRRDALRTRGSGMTGNVKIWFGKSCPGKTRCETGPIGVREVNP